MRRATFRTTGGTPRLAEIYGRAKIATKDDGDEHEEQRPDEDRLPGDSGGFPAPATSAISSAVRPRLL